MEIQFKKANRKVAKMRIALLAPSGFGKTFSALRIAKGLGGKIALIDTEAGSAELYGNEFDYDVVTMNPPYQTEKYIAAIHAAEEAGYDTVIIDSLSHAWAGSGGLLDKQGSIADKGGNSFAAWRTVTPDHTKLVDTILHSKCHVIATMRSKTEYALEGGRVVKLGLAPVQRDGIEYEFGLVFDIDKNHQGHTSKDRTGIFDNKIVPMDENIGKVLNEWLYGKSEDSSKTES